MTTSQLFEFLLELNQEAAKELIEIYKGLPTYKKQTCLILPQYREGKNRISEQELRFVITNLFGLNNYPDFSYAVEVPTENEYTFSGTNPRSASTDLAFYDEIKSKVLNIELKAHNPKQESFSKDIDKLFNENVHGAWCHLLENADRGTLDSIFSKFINAISVLSLKQSNSQSPIIPQKPIYFSFIILEKNMLISRKGKDSDLINFNPNSIFSLTYGNYNNLGKGKHFIGDWQIDVF